MNKKLVTLAVAAALAAPAAAFADATLYGKAHVSLDYVDVDAFAWFGSPPSQFTFSPLDAGVAFEEAYQIALDEGLTQDQAAWTAAQAVNLIADRSNFKGWGLSMNSRASRVGVKGSEDLGGGLKAIYQIEFGVDLSNENRDLDIDNGNRGSGVAMRNTFVGLAGNWGTFLMGRHDTPLKISTGRLDLFSDTLADYNYTIGFNDIRADNAVAYISPSFAGLQFAGAVIPSGGATPVSSNVGNINADGIADAWSVALIYSNGPFYASAAYELLGKKHWQQFDRLAVDPLTGFEQPYYLGRPLFGGEADDWGYWRLGLGLLDWNGFTLDGIWESHTNYAGAPEKADVTLWQVQAAYAFGNNTIKGMYGQSDLENCVDVFSATCNLGQTLAGDLYLNARDQSSWAVGFDHNFSKRTQVYMLYTATSSDTPNADWSGFSLGMIHNF